MLKGNLSAGVTGKDVIIALCGLFNKDEVLNHAVEFMGDGAANLPMSARMTIANMTTEWGALAGVFPFDEVTVNYLRSRVPRVHAIRNARERAARRVAPDTQTPTSTHGGRIEASSAPTPTRNTPSSLNSISRPSFRTCPGLTK